MSDSEQLQALNARVQEHLSHIYDNVDYAALAADLLAAMCFNHDCATPGPLEKLWDEADIIVITYGNTFQQADEKPLHSLHRFLTTYLADTVNAVHILPFFPFSSDDGFAVMEYTQVNESYGDWTDINAIAADFRLMSDLVINHCSGRSRWFEQFLHDEAPANRYFICESPNTDLTKVTRPRTSPLLREVSVNNESKHVWCTFSHDQPDLNFRNPEVLLEFIRIIRFYLDQGVRIFRLDAVAFLWKEIGTDCLNRPQTHEIVRLIRTLIEHDALLVSGSFRSRSSLKPKLKSRYLIR